MQGNNVAAAWFFDSRFHSFGGHVKAVGTSYGRQYYPSWTIIRPWGVSPNLPVCQFVTQVNLPLNAPDRVDFSSPACRSYYPI